MLVNIVTATYEVSITIYHPTMRQSPEEFNCDYLLTYLLTPWSRDLLEKLTGFQLVKKFPAIYTTRRFMCPLPVPI